MTNRLQRWGERALGEVKSVAPRVASRFEPEPLTSTPGDISGFQEVAVETPAPKQPTRRVPTAEPPVPTEPPAPPKLKISRKRVSEAPPIQPHSAPSLGIPEPPPSKGAHEPPAHS